MTLQEEAYRRLEEMIVTLELAPGSVVSEASLGRLLGIGTTPVREALQRLARCYLVRILPRRGVIVTDIDLRLQVQVLETRRELDRLIVRSAATRATALERAELKALSEEIKAQIGQFEIREMLRLDNRMNELLALAARNDVASDASAMLHATSRRFWFHHHEEGAGLDETISRHAGIAAAVAAGDADAAAAQSDLLVDHLAAFARQTLR